MSLGFTTLFHSTLQQFSPTKTRHFSYKNQTFFGPSPTKTRHFSYKNQTFFCLSYKNQTFFGTHFTSLPNNSLSSLRESFCRMKSWPSRIFCKSAFQLSLLNTTHREYARASARHSGKQRQQPKFSPNFALKFSGR